MQIVSLHREADALQAHYGDETLRAIYGAGCTSGPRAMLVFMNPTAKNISAQPGWSGLRAPWLGTKNVWGLLHELGLTSIAHNTAIQTLKSSEWTENFCHELYAALSDQGIYITNLAKCTQVDARPLKDEVFRQYLNLMHQEIIAIQPERIITFGNQVSSILLNQPVRVSQYHGLAREMLALADHSYVVYPTYYPVGHGRMNQPLAIKRIKKVLATVH